MATVLPLFDLGRVPTTRDIAQLVKEGGLSALPDAKRRGDAATYQEIRCRSALNRCKGMPFMKWTLNPYRGCTHGCHYCFARRYHVQFEMNSDDEFASVILVKRNFVEILRRELDKPGWTRDQVAFGRIPKPPAERRAAVRAYIAELHRIWEAEHFLQPEPEPPIFFGAFGPMAAKLAGAHADGIAAAVDGFGPGSAPIEERVAIAQEAREAKGRQGAVRVIAHTGPDDDAGDPEWRVGSHNYDRLERLGAERLVLFIPPAVEAVREAARTLPRAA